MNKYTIINDYINKIRDLQVEALQEIHDILVTKLDDTYEISKVIKGLNLDELKVENRNDYRNYVWLTIKHNNEEYWISTMYEDQDFETGNMHHQFARIQFWKDINQYSKQWCSTQNTPVGDNYHWIFNYDKSFDPKIKIYDEDFSPVEVVDKFIEFIK